MNMNVGMSDPNNTAAPNQSAGGNTKITPTSKEGPSYDGTQGYGFMPNASNPNMVIQGKAGGPTLPSASPITPMIFGDPNNTPAGDPSK